ncbi:hypothetical protein ACA910_002256 [Epithemia clementina (nom. ined.)]
MEVQSPANLSGFVASETHFENGGRVNGVNPGRGRASAISRDSSSMPSSLNTITTSKGLKPADVLLGRGKRAYEHRGNKAYMDIIFSYLPDYTATTRNKDKSHITTEVVALVKKNGGRFLGIDQPNHELYEVSDAEARIKVSQALRHQRLVLDRKKQRKKSGKLSKRDRADSQDMISCNNKAKEVGARGGRVCAQDDPSVRRHPTKQQQEFSEAAKLPAVTFDFSAVPDSSEKKNDYTLSWSWGQDGSGRMTSQSCPVVPPCVEHALLGGGGGENIPKGTTNEVMLYAGGDVNDDGDVLDGLIEYSSLLLDMLGLDGHNESSS